MHPIDEQLKQAIERDDLRDERATTVLITHDLINSYRTPRGGWTRKVLEAFGVAWPPPNGWKKRLVYARKRIKISDLPPLQQTLFLENADRER